MLWKLSLSSLLTISLWTALWSCPIHAVPISRAPPKRSTGFDIPFERRETQRNDLRARGSISGTTGLGDHSDLVYSVPVEFGKTVAAVHLDTGSADLWAVSDACTSGGCANAAVTKLPAASLNMTGTSVTMRYGDSKTGTQASGQVAFDTVTVAGIAMENSPFAAINNTTNTVLKYGSSGLFGLGFPTQSVIHSTLVSKQTGSGSSDEMILASLTDSPLLSRIASTKELKDPMFSISLQRHTIDIGGGNGTLSVGKLPEGVDNSSLIWVPVRRYSETDGGVSPPSFAPNEVYPFRWEIDIDAVFLNGKKLANSTIPASSGVDGSRTSALIDSGNSLLRGPQDVVDKVFTTLSPQFDASQAGRAPLVPCNTPINLEFQIGGKMFPIDPRDMIGPSYPGNTTTCVVDKMVSSGDAPAKGALFRWSLGDPFFKSNLVAFHYGNLTHPSVDPPRIGLKSNVPAGANELLVQAVSDAKADGAFESKLVVAPTSEAAAATQVTLAPGPNDAKPTAVSL